MSLKIKIGGMLKSSLIETDGIGAVIFFQGCNRYCPECHNVDLQPIDGGREIDTNDLNLDIDWHWVDYVVASGGEPLLQPQAVTALGWLAHVNSKKLWVYTGWEFEDIYPTILECADVIKTGKFVKKLADPTLLYRGSSNQKLWKKYDGVWKEWNIERAKEW